jgi:DNA-3-methyladenine glycosylase II
MSLAIRPVQPFDLSRSLSFLCGFGPMQGEQVVGPAQITKAVFVEGDPVVFRVRPAKRGDVLDVDLFSEAPLRAARWRRVLDHVRTFLGTDEDLSPFYEQAANDGAMAPLVSRLRGLHHVKFPSAFEAACWGLINQRIGMTQARRMKDALVRRAGRSLLVDGVEHWAFPEPAAVLGIPRDELAQILPGARRAEAVHAVAEAFRDVDPKWLREAPLEEVRAWLLAIDGVGPFTAGFVLYRGLGRFGGGAVVSPRLVSIAEQRYGRPLSQDDVGTLADGYGAWGGYWMLYLWASTFVD